MPSALFIVVTSAINSHTTFAWELLRPLRESCWTFCFGALLAFAVTAQKGTWAGRFFASRPLTFLGKYSYGLYVFHQFVAQWVRNQDFLPRIQAVVSSHLLAVLLQAAAGIGVSVAVAVASYQLYEKRFLALKSRFEGRREPRVAADPA